MDLSEMFVDNGTKVGLAKTFGNDDHTKNKYLDWVDRILGLQSGKEKWLQIAELLIQVNPGAREQFILAHQEAKDKNRILANAVGASKDMSIRHTATFPACLLDALFVLDPELKHNLDSTDRDVRKRTLLKLVRAFKGFQVPEKL